MAGACTTQPNHANVGTPLTHLHSSQAVFVVGAWFSRSTRHETAVDVAFHSFDFGKPALIKPSRQVEHRLRTHNAHTAKDLRLTGLHALEHTIFRGESTSRSVEAFEAEITVSTPEASPLLLAFYYCASCAIVIMAVGLFVGAKATLLHAVKARKSGTQSSG